MTDKTITVSIDSELLDLLNKRAKKSLMNTPELIEDIIRRSMISYGRKTKNGDVGDDKLVGLFSRRKKQNNKSKTEKREKLYYSTPLGK